MGFDNECIVDIQSLPGEYFCPVCRTLIYPEEALQSQCTHLYCKPCLAYVVATTHACPYDGYLVTEADSKPLSELNKSLAETIGKVAVHCLYHRSGCTWQGTLAECTTHCTGCNYGNSPVVCNRCGTQITHRQVQEHAQICPGVQPQAQQADNAQSKAVAAPSQASAQDPSATTTVAPLTTGAPAAIPSSTVATTAAVASAATAVPAQTQAQGGAAFYPQAASAEQYYQQQQQQLQYQQYYQQYPGYDPYQQQYQQYAQYQQQGHPQYMQPQMQATPQQVFPGQQQPQPYTQGQPQPQTHPQPLPQQQPQPQLAQPQLQQQPQPQLAQPQLHQQPQPQLAQPQLHQHLPHPQTQHQSLPQAQTQTQPQPHLQSQIPQMQGQQMHVPAQQPQAQPPPHAMAGQPPHSQSHQLHLQPQPHTQTRPPQLLPGPPQHQQPVPIQQHPPAQMPYPQPHPQQQLRPQHPPPQSQQPAVQPQPHPQAIPQSQNSHPSGHAVSGYQSYPQTVSGTPQQRPMHMHPQQVGMPPPPQHPQHPPQTQGQFPPQPPQMRPPHQMPMQVQHPAVPPHGPPANIHPGQQQVQHPMHQPGMQQPPPQHGFPQPQTQGHLHPGQMQQQGVLAPQQQIYPQQPVRPQGPAYMQQHISGQPSQQGLPTHQAQTRPLASNMGMPLHPQQTPGPGSGPKVMLPGQSPTQTYPGRSTRVPTSSELQQPQLPHPGSQGSVPPASPATAKQGSSLPDKTGKHMTQLEAGMTAKVAEGAESADKLPDHVSEEKSAGKEKGVHVENDGNEVSKSTQALESLGNEEDADGKVKAKDDEATKTSNEELRGHEDKSDEKSGARVPGEAATSDKSPQRPNLDAIQTQEMPAPGGLIRGQPVHPVHQTAIHSQERGLPQPPYSDRNSSQFPQQYPGSDDRRGVHAGGGPFPNQERYPPQQVPFGHPSNMPDQSTVSQRPPAPERMFPQSMPPSSQERRFPEQPPHQMQLHGPSMPPPPQMRPPGHNYRETFPHQGQTPVAREPFWPPPHAGGAGPGLPPPPSVVPGHPPHAGFEQHSMPPSGQSQSHMPPPHAGAARAAPGEPFARPGPPPGLLDTPNGMMGGGVGQSPPVHSMEGEVYGFKRSGVYDGQPSGSKLNGMPNAASIGEMHDSAFAHGMPEERFKPFPEERFNASQDRFRPPAMDPGRNANRREFEEDLKQFPRPMHLDEGPKFDGYMSSSRPSDRGPHVSRGHNVTTSRPLSSYQSGSPFPPGAGGSIARLDMGDRDRPDVFHEHMGRKHDAALASHHNPASDFARHRMDGLPPLRSPGREYDGFSSSRFGLGGQSRRDDFEERDPHGFGQRFRTSKFPPPGPSDFSREYPDGPGSFRSDHMGSGSMPGQLGRSFDGSNIRGGEPLGAVGFRSHLGIGEHGGPENLPSHLRFGDSAFNGHFNSVSREGELDSFERSRKRKPGSMGWCRICKIDCETVEGLDLHSQTREHQKMAMDLVLRIKQENAKKHKFTSENAMPFDESNKSRKANFENSGKRK